jgi:hypothetical protein
MDPRRPQLTRRPGESKTKVRLRILSRLFAQSRDTLSTDFSTDMKIKPEQAERLAEQILKSYRAKELIVLKAQESAVRTKIKNIIVQNFHEEEVIEEEARKMLASHAGEVRQAGDMDQHKMFLLIKQKLAQKKGFVL